MSKHPNPPSRLDMERQTKIVQGVPPTEVFRDYFGHFRADAPYGYAAAEARAHDIFGLTPFHSKSSRSACPLWVLGRRCPHWQRGCFCEDRLNDHGGYYKDDDGKRVVVWEPYGFNAKALVEVVAAAEAEGLWVHVTPSSPWYPGRTIALIFRAKEN